MKIDETRLRRIIRDAFEETRKTSVDYTDGFLAAVRAVMVELDCDPSHARYLVQQLGGRDV